MKLQSAQLFVVALGLTAAVSANGSLFISDTGFGDPNHVVYANGSYVPNSPGYAHLEFADGTDAVVGAKETSGPFGNLANVTMSFTYANFTFSPDTPPPGPGVAPFAALGASTDGLWTGSAQQFLIIAVNDQQIIGSTPIHVYDKTLNQNYAPVPWGTTFASLLSMPYGSGTFGDLPVLRAYAYIGDWPGIQSASVDITSITVNVIPEPSTCIAATLLLVPFGMSAVRRLRKSRAA